MYKFVHFHTHSDASQKDGLGPVSELIATAKELGFGALGLSDHGTLANAVAFTIECEKQGIKPILGVEGYIAIDSTIGHITLFANGNTGWENLVALNNLGHASAFREPAFTLDQLLAYSDNLLCFTGCPASPLNSLPWERALDVGRQLKLAFKDRLFAEVTFVGNMPTWERPYALSQELKIPVVVTNDVHFAERGDADVHRVLTRIKAGFTYEDDELYLKTPSEIMHHARRLMKSKFDESLVTKWILNSYHIAQKVEPVKLSAVQKLPRVDGAKSKLQSLATKNMGHILIGRKAPAEDVYEYRMRLEYELDIIDRMHYNAYFVILDDIVRQAREDGVRIGAGRGSGAGSLVLYALGITDIDPIEYNLSFERFLNPERKGMPDVDMDFDSERRHLVLEYAAKKYHAMPIATYSRYQHKSLVHDLAKHFLVSKPLEEQAAELGPESKQFLQICESKPEFQKAYDLMINQIRHKGKHAGGVVITNTAVPIERTGDTLSVGWTEGHNSELSYAGVVKFDLLGLSSLSILRRLETKHLDFDYSFPTHEEVFEIFRNGDLAGIFQFSGSSGIRNLTMQLQPTSIHDLIAINALYRPGALDAGTCEKYPDYKKTPRKVPELFADILAETYGVIVYQEQLMSIIQRALGGTFAQADLARRIITKGGKKMDDPVHIKELQGLHDDVVGGFIGRGLSPKEAEKWWSELETHGRYSFNKSHSTGYAMIAWQMAWWKFYYPADFYAECLNVDAANSQDYIMSAVESGVRIARPDINAMVEEWSAKDNTIILPLSALKYLSVDVARMIVSNRPYSGYSSIEEFMRLNPKKVVRAQAREALWYLQAFSKIPGDFADLQFPKGRIAVPMLPAEIMRKYLGFIIPTHKQLVAIKEYKDAGYLVGIVSGRKLKKSSYGPYIVYYLSPTGVFWSRDITDLVDGQIVAVKTTGRGKAKELAKI